MVDGGWWTVDGGWRMVGGRWRVVDGGWCGSVISLLPLSVIMTKFISCLFVMALFRCFIDLLFLHYAHLLLRSLLGWVGDVLLRMNAEKVATLVDESGESGKEAA